MNYFVRLASLGVIAFLAFSHARPQGVQSFNPARHYMVDGKVAVKNQLIVAVRDHQDVFDLKAKSATVWAAVQSAQTILNRADKDGMFHVVQLNLNPQSDTKNLLDVFKKDSDVIWVQPNFVYNINFDPREHTPNDTKYSDQYHHTLMHNDAAWDNTQGESILVAVTDDGFALSHPDLKDNVWTNTGEIPGNGIDDDHNGYVDDVHGWDFCHNNNDPTNDTPDDSHGTHVAGIVAGRTDNQFGIAGTAGRATFMPIQFYGDCDWTSTLVASAYKYAADNGARIITTSYNIDGFADDAVFAEAVDYVYNKGLLQFNSAGNSGVENPKRFKFTQLLMVASSDKSDVKSDFSNYGTNVDITAPGTDIVSSVPGDTWDTFSGTSMATPNAAGVAALIWSQHPDWNRNQVAAVLYATADTIDRQNPTYVGKLGRGRANSAAAIATSALPAPGIKSISGIPGDGGSTTSHELNVVIAFNQLLDPASASNMNNWKLDLVGLNGSTTPITITPNEKWNIGTNEMAFKVSNLTAGKYRLSVRNGLKNPFGKNMELNYIHEFNVN